MQLLSLAGHAPNLQTDVDSKKLLPNQTYNFDFEAMAFSLAPGGRFRANHIKLLRLGFSGNRPKILQQVNGVESLLTDIAPLVQTMLKTYIRV
jgi:hypothetical protein